MNSYSQRTASIYEPSEATEKRRAAFTPTVSSDDEESSSEEQEVVSRKEQTECTTAGLFIYNPTDKPLPLSFQRSIPLPRFWKRNNPSKPSKAAPDILRRTGSSSALFSQDSTYCQTSEYAHGSWACPNCNHENAASTSCELCGAMKLHKQKSSRQHKERRQHPCSRQSAGDPTQTVSLFSNHSRVSDIASQRKKETSPTTSSLFSSTSTSLGRPYKANRSDQKDGELLSSSEHIQSAYARSPPFPESRCRTMSDSIGLSHPLSSLPTTNRRTHGTSPNTPLASKSCPLNTNDDMHIEGKSPIRRLGAPIDETVFTGLNPGLFSVVKQRIGTDVDESLGCRLSVERMPDLLSSFPQIGHRRRASMQ